MSTIANLSPVEIQRLASPLYAGASSAKVRLMATYRSHICPLHEVIREVPARSRVLDVGCGQGLLLNLLARLGHIRQGHGFDVAATAIAVARQVADQQGLSSVVGFEHRTIAQGLPDIGHEVVTVIDVLHHVPDQHKAAFVGALCDVVPEGGLLIVKDMVVRPRWRAAANRLHDLIMARQWVEHLDPGQVEAWATQRGMRVTRLDHFNTWWYGHWLLVLEKRGLKSTNEQVSDLVN
jgi:2-polyprenyl-3-methyl-5-hydroxy-6-metoxy-1,4-benzoquinol methylase